MLTRIFIKNIALIDKIEVDFSSGLNILTGETGAGKSIIVDSINMVLGNRASKDIIRTGQNSALVEAFFDDYDKTTYDFLERNGLLDEENSSLILSREININGRNICRVNGRAVSVSVLKEIGQSLIDIHGQHDNQSLLNVHKHIDLLDSYGGERVISIKNDYLKLYNNCKEIEKKIEELGGDKIERERKLDLLKYQYDEIKSAKLTVNEDIELENQKNIMMNSNKLVSGIEQTYNILCSGDNNQSILDGLNIILKELASINQFDSKITEFVKKIEEIYYVAEDVGYEINSYKQDLEFEPELLEEIEERLDMIYKLKRKYGDSVDDILKYAEDLDKEIHDLESSQERLEEYSKELFTQRDQMQKRALELSKVRKEVARELEQKVVKELEDLQMKKTQFKVYFSEENTKYTLTGMDKIEFLISPNVGEDLKSLSKIASGGEMSRIMLAIKTILAQVDKIPTLIFDEIDNGISGVVAQMVGKKLSYISKNHQSLCITHLPHIASMSDSHYLIEKHIEDGVTKTTIKKLTHEGKKYEIARIIGGMSITETTLKSAQEMIEYAKSNKNA